MSNFNPNGFTNEALQGVRHEVENQMGQAIDHYASHVPGGTQFTPEAKRALAGVLDGLQGQLEQQAASHFGGNAGSSNSHGNSISGSQGDQGSLL
ncbi:hypothetical protein [Tengunoibacter tsumagoiensis]|uniref:Uncharacterized protein n=1 Tax=Tengunoibacter tsumagoiensis TaxID=2014871 RepID=A0A401ZTR5_9CHLR|nr:hypothetical protein [Tengunoibacter tsumagoiensis]GCE10275.1 hypothetical protein KTT_01340 [Tengunoibacter tsumagoiensis]